MRVLIIVIVGVFALFLAQAGVGQGLSGGAAGSVMSVRHEVAQAGAVAKVDPTAAREALSRAVAGLVQASGGAASARQSDDAENNTTDAATHGRDAWTSFQPADYAVVVDLASQLDAPAAMRKALADCWLDRVAADEAFRAAMSGRQLLVLGRLVKAVQPQRLDAVLTVVTARLEQVQQLPSPSVVALCDLLEAFALGGAPAAEEFHTLLQRLTTAKNGRFSKELAPFEIARLAEYCTASGNPDVAENLRAFVVREYLAEPGIAAAMRLTDWSELLELLAGSREDALRRAMVVSTVRHAGPTLAGARRDAAAEFLQKVEQAGGTAADVNALAMRWMGVAPGASGAGSGGAAAAQNVAAIRAILAAPDDQAVRAAMMKNLGDHDAMAAAVEAAVKERDDAVDAALRTLRARHTAGQLDAPGYGLACRLARESGSAQAAAFWSAAALERFLQSKGNGDDALALLEAAASADTKLSTISKENAETAEKLLARLGAFQNDSWRISDATLQALAAACDRAGLTDTLYKALALPDGSGPDFIAVKLLAWIKREQKQIRPFIGQLAAPTEKTRGDARARWELARAYAVSLVEPRAPRRTDGNGHIRLALQASRSDATLIMCLEELINACKPTHSYTFPLQIITSSKDRLEGQTKQRIDQMEQQLRKAMAAAQTAQPTAAVPSATPTGTTPAGQPDWQMIYDKKRQQMQRG